MELQVKNSEGEAAGSVTFPWEEMEKSLLEKLKASSPSVELAETIKLREADVVALQEQVEHLGSKDHQTEVIRGWATRLTPEAYLKLGEELGFDVSVPVEEAAVAETPPKKRAIVYKDPHDSEYTAVPGLGCWVLPTKSAPVADKV